MKDQTQKDQIQSGSPVKVQPSRARSNLRKKMKTIASSSLTEVSDEESFAFSFDLGVKLLLQDQSCCSKLVLGTFARMLQNVLGSHDLLGFIDDCAYLRSELVQTGRWNADLSKGHGRRWVRGLVMAIEMAIPGYLIVHPSRHFNLVATFLGWLKRLPVCIRDTTLSVDEYFECDARIAKIDFSAIAHVPKLREIWLEWFGSFTLHEPFLPQHGSGATADAGRTRHDKWCALAVDRRAHVCLRSARLEHIHGLHVDGPSRSAKVVFVPKQAGKDRTICMEPAWLQYLQQGVARQLVAYASTRSRSLSQLVTISNQENNRRLCACAYDQSLATIDLTNASDSVSWQLISELTRGTALQRLLFATRSTHTVIDGRVVEMAKYAPMGSALCFPIECFLFASVVELAYRERYGQASQGHHSGCSVYGDDIICPAALYQRVVDILTAIGFVVNVSKSYSSGAYYESCGVEYCHGVSIKSIRHPRHHVLCRGVGSPEMVGLITDLSNSLSQFGSFDARRALLLQWSEVSVVVESKSVPFMDLMRFDGDHCTPIITPYVNTYYCKKLQCRVERVWSCDTRAAKADSDFLQWKSDLRPRSREQRIRDLHPLMYTVVDPKFSRKGVICLSRLGFRELIEGNDIEDVGHRATGRLRRRLVRRTKPAVNS